MDQQVAGMLGFHYRRTYDRVLALIDDLSDAQLAWRPAPAGHSIAWNLWHLARWSDYLQATIPGMTPALGASLGPGRQVWEAQDLAGRWGLPAAALGAHETGMLMSDEVAAGLALPGKAALLDYARLAFAAAERAVAAIDDGQLLAPNDLEAAASPDSPRTVGDAIITYLTHTNRHLGEIECLRGLQGLRGTATR